VLRDLIVPIKGGRDDGKIFTIRELPAYDLEWWYIRAVMALGTSGITVPQDIVDAGAVGLAFLGYQTFAGAKPEAIKPLRDEMMERVWFTPEGADPMPWHPSLVFDVGTLKTLREKWMELHTGFTLADVARKLSEAVAAKRAMQTSLNTEMSPEPSEQSSA
jgi:hypothetical protein